jgi:hypothetical protein
LSITNNESGGLSHQANNFELVLSFSNHPNVFLQHTRQFLVLIIVLTALCAPS